MNKLNSDPQKSNYLARPPKLNGPTQIPKMCNTSNNSTLSTGESVKYLGINTDIKFLVPWI